MRIVATELTIINMKRTLNHNTQHAAPAGYVEVCNYLQTHSKRISRLWTDEFEKAHREVRRLFMSALDAKHENRSW